MSHSSDARFSQCFALSADSHEVKAGSSQWRNHFSKTTRRENHWLASKNWDRERISQVGR